MRDSTVNYIDTPEALARFAREHQLRGNWHEPDEQGIDAYVVGSRLDNAFGSSGMRRAVPDPEIDRATELRVVITLDEDGTGLDPRPTAIVNLADLLAWASSSGVRG